VLDWPYCIYLIYDTQQDAYYENSSKIRLTAVRSVGESSSSFLISYEERSLEGTFKKSGTPIAIAPIAVTVKYTRYMPYRLNNRNQAVSRRLPTATARVRFHISSCGISSGQSGAGVGFPQVLQFPLQILIPPTAPYSLIILPSTLYRLLKMDIGVRGYSTYLNVQKSPGQHTSINQCLLWYGRGSCDLSSTCSTWFPRISS
jgi:hypothetical protein